MNMRLNEEMKKKIKAVVEYLEYRNAPFKYALSEFNFLIIECADAIEMDRKKLTILVQNKLFDKLGLEFVNKQKELFKEAGIPYTYCSVRVHKAKKNTQPNRDRVEPYSKFGKMFKERFGVKSKDATALYQACYHFYKDNGKYLWEDESWNVIKTKYGVE